MSIGVIVDVRGTRYTVFNKLFSFCEKHFTAEPDFYTIGEQVKWEKEKKNIEKTDQIKSLAYGSSKESITPPYQQLTMDLYNVSLTPRTLRKGCYFYHEILGLIKDPENLLNFKRYQKIRVKQTGELRGFYWQVVLCFQLKEETIASFINYKFNKKPCEPASSVEKKKAFAFQDLKVVNFLLDVHVPYKDQKELQKMRNPDPPLKISYGSLILDDNQEKTLRRALNDECKIMLMGGAPGTGKTVVITELICELILRKQKALVLLPTLMMENNLTESVRKRCCQAQIDISSTTIMNSYSYYSKLKNHRLLGQFPHLKKKLIGKAFPKSADEAEIIRSIKEQIYADLFGDTLIVFAEIGEEFLDELKNENMFHAKTVIVDDANNVMEKRLFPFVHKFHKLILAGDICSFPKLKSRVRRTHYSNTPVMRRLYETGVYSDCVLLETQYRMAPKIDSLRSSVFGQNGVINYDETVTDLSIATLPSVIEKNLASNHYFKDKLHNLLMFDTGLQADRQGRTCKFKYLEQWGYYGIRDWHNPGEVEIIFDYVKDLIEVGVDPSIITIITPFYAQKKLLEKTFKNDLEVQIEVGLPAILRGQERQIVILSLVRSNQEGNCNIPYLSTILELVTTRACRQFVCVGNSNMFENEEYLKKLHEQFMNPEVGVVFYPPPSINFFKNSFAKFRIWFTRRLRDQERRGVLAIKNVMEKHSKN